jgi:hypothetical protein
LCDPRTLEIIKKRNIQLVSYRELWEEKYGARAQQSIQLLVRADDMGVSHDVNLAIIKAYREGILTSAGLMPPSRYFEEAVQLCKENPGLAAGIHLTLLGTRERPVLSPSEVPSLVTSKGFFHETLEQLENANPDPEEIQKEIMAQLGKASAAGLEFVYIDMHRGVPFEAIEKVIIGICRDQELVYAEHLSERSFPSCRRKDLVPESWPNRILPDGSIVYYAAPALTREEEELFFDALRGLEPGRWMTLVHPGLAGPQRASVTQLLYAPRTREIIREKNIQLVSYYDLQREAFGKTGNR